MARNKQKRFDYDLIIIGSGAGGSVAAHLANKAGKSVAIVEADLIGGECPNVGCVPTKALLQAASVYETAKHGDRFGIRGKIVSFNYPSIRAWKDLAVKRTGTYLGEEIFTKEGISLLRGNAHFLDAHTISVGANRFSGKNFIIASGSSVAIPPIIGLEQTGFITHEGALDLNRPPRSLAIIGGGAIGCEFAQAFAIFGTKVHIIDIAPRLLSREDPAAGDMLAQHLEDNYPLKLHMQSSVEKVESFNTRKRLTIKDADGNKHLLVVDEIFVATGKKPNTDLGLENAGVDFGETGILVNRQLQTTAHNIYAAGDCVGPYQFTHTATYQSKIAAHNILHPRKHISADYRAVPRCIFTTPEVAAVGPTEAELIRTGQNIKQASVPINVIGRANTADVHDGFVSVIIDDKTHQLLSATIVSPRAGEMIHELTLAVQNRLTAEGVAETIHAFPTWSEAVRVACNKVIRS